MRPCRKASEGQCLVAVSRDRLLIAGSTRPAPAIVRQIYPAQRTLDPERQLRTGKSSFADRRRLVGRTPLRTSLQSN